jgi:hypothetical protein
MKRAIVTLAIGPWENLPPVHDPMIKYADYCDADFIKITKRMFPDLHVFYEKFQIASMLGKGGYDEILYLDGDILVTPLAFEAPNWFDVPPEYNLAMMDERAQNDFQTRSWVDDQYILVGEDVPADWDGHYYNAGAYLIRKDAVEIYESDLVTREDYQDQITMNVEISKHPKQYEVFRMNWKYDCMPIACLHVDQRKAYLLHYGGWNNFDMDVAGLMGLISAWPYFPNFFVQRRKVSIDYQQCLEMKGPSGVTPFAGAKGTQGTGVGSYPTSPQPMKFPVAEKPAQERRGPLHREAGR